MRGPDLYTYELFRNDLNTLHPHIVRSVDQMRRAMTGRLVHVPRYWEKPVNELLELAVTGHTHPPTPGPFWHPMPLSRKERLALVMLLPRWMRNAKIYNTGLAMRAEITMGRLSRLRKGTTAVLPTEIERIAAVFGTDRAGFLNGP